VLSANTQSEDFIALITRFQPRIFLFILSLVPNRADAEDVLSDTTLVLWRKFGEFRPGSDFRAWAFEIASRRAKAYWESAQRRGLRLSDEFLETVAAQASQAPDNHHSMLEALDHCKQKLRLADQDLLQRRYQPGATAAAVAVAVGRSEMAVHKAISRIRQALLECVQKTMAQGEHP
jgi:RNA polymerase sigma-70 factor, ECF subfamily